MKTFMICISGMWLLVWLALKYINRKDKIWKEKDCNKGCNSSLLIKTKFKMKRLFFMLLLIVAVTFTSCEDECTQPALCTQVSASMKLNVSASNLVLVDVCHNGSTIKVDSASLQSHLDHGDTEGECDTLSDGGLVFRDGEVVEIPCRYGLPFLYTDDSGVQWLYTDADKLN